MKVLNSATYLKSKYDKHAREQWKETLSLNQYGWWRWGSIVLLAVVARLVIDMVFAITYPGYKMFSAESIYNYFYTTGFAFVIVEGIRAINRELNGLFPWEHKPFKRFLIQAITNIIYFLFINNAIRLALYVLVFPDRQIVLWEQIVINIVVVALLLIVELIDFGIYLLNKWRFSLGEVERFKKESIEFQLATLKAQVNPHFLFNSLNTLSSLIYQDTDTAALFVQRLAKVYRYVLENKERELVKLSEEIKFLEDYISLLKTRFGESILFELDIPKYQRHKFIAPMTVQMLVENAIKHNVKSRRKPLHVKIKYEGSKVSVTNNVQLKKRVGFSSGIGLVNVRNRYKFLTDEKVDIIHNEEQFCVKIPVLDIEDFDVTEYEA